MGKIIKNGIEYSSAVPDLTNILHTELDAYTADFDEKLATKTSTYTTLEQLGLTADATVEDVVSALKNGESFLAPVNTFTNYTTIFPNKVPNDQWNKIHIIKGTSLASSHIRCFSPSGTFEYLANINNTSIVGWNDVGGTYTDISDAVIEKLGTEILKYPVGKYRINSTTTGNKFTDLPSKAEMKCGLIEINGTAVGKSPFVDTWVYRMYKFETLTGSSIYTRRLNSGATAGQIEVDTEWRKVGQEIFTSLEELGLTADATIDNVIDALKEGETALISTNEFTNYKDGMFPNQCTNDNYAVIKVEKESGSKVFLEWRQKEGNAYAIGGLNSNNKFTNWNNLVRFKKDGFADDSIVCIGDTVSNDGVIQTLANLGFTTDVMTWNTGVYRVSHIEGLTNLPTDIASTAPGFRLEHHDIKKWGSNHNPNTSTWALRHSVLYAENGNVYSRFTESGATAGVLITDTGWRKFNTNNSISLVTNTSTLKLDVTKKNASWYGAIKLTYLYDTSPVEVEIDFRSATDTLEWTISKGQKYIKKITYTQDSSNKAHYTIGIEFSGTTYGCYQAEVIGGFADINSLTEDAFTGDTTAVYGASWGKNNGVTLVSTPEDIGLTSPCTTVQLVQTMRNTFNRTVTSGAIGVFNNGGNTITDAPSDYGLLHIEVFGHDRVMIRYDGIGGSTYAGSWIGKIKGSNGTFSGITWDKPATEDYINEMMNNTIGGKTIKSLEIDLSSADYKPSSTTSTTTMPIKGLANKAKVIRVEGYYIESDGDIHAVTLNTSQPGNIACSSAGIWTIAMTASSTGQGSGYAKIYYID